MAQPASTTGNVLLRQDVNFRRTVFVVLFIAIGQFILQVSLLGRGVEYIATSLMIDDTYYYLQTAWNTRHLGFVTFDGLHSTNGVQFLWFVIILLLAMVANTKLALLFATMVVSFLLNGLCYLVILKIGSVLKQSSVALLMAGLWALQSLPFRIYSTGMENSLHALVFWCVIWQSITFLVRVQNRSKPNFWGLTIVLVLNVWTRLDSALLSAVIYAFCMVMLASSYQNNFRSFLQEHLKAIAGTGLFAAFGLVTQLSAFWLMGNSILPVSALIKTNGSSRGLSTAALDKLGEVITLGMPSILQGRFPTPALVLLGISCILIVLGARRAILNRSKELLVLLNLWACLLVGEILYHVYIAISGVQYTLYFMWYRSPSFVFWIITFSLIGILAFEYLKPIKQLFKVSTWAPIAFSLLLFAVAIYMFVRSINFTAALYVARYDAAQWIAENFGPDVIFASWNSGQLGFFSNRTFINLDGVINNVDYYERVLRGSVSLHDYLAENGVDYLVDYDSYDSIPDLPVLRSFPLDDESGKSIQIWQVTNPISSVR